MLSLPAYPVTFSQNIHQTKCWRSIILQWEAPSDLLSKKPLLASCEKNRYLDSSTSETILTHFFQKTLKVPDIDIGDLINELSVIRDAESDRLPRLPGIYMVRFTRWWRKVAQTWNQSGELTIQFIYSVIIACTNFIIRDTFETDRYIYVSEKSGWYGASSCVW